MTHTNKNGKPRSMRPTRDFSPANSTQLALRGLTVKEQKAPAENGTLHVTKVLDFSEQLQETVLSKEFIAIQKFILEAFGTDEDEINGYITGSLQFKKDTPFEKLFYQLILSANFIHRLMDGDVEFILKLDRHGDAYVRRILVDLDAKLTELSIDIVGNSLAHHIVLYGTDDQLQQLLLYNVNLLHRNREGQTPLELAKTIAVHLSHQSNIIKGEPSRTNLSRLYHRRITMLENIIKTLTAQQKITEGIDKLRELEFSACSRLLNESTDLSNVPLHSKFKYLLSGGAQYLLQAHEFWYFLSCPTIMRIVQYVRESPSRERHIVKLPEHVYRALENYTPRNPITVVRLLLQFDHYPPELTALYKALNKRTFAMANNNTPVHVLAQYPFIETIYAMLLEGASVTAINTKSQTAIDVARVQLTEFSTAHPTAETDFSQKELYFTYHCLKRIIAMMECKKQLENIEALCKNTAKADVTYHDVDTFFRDAVFYQTSAGHGICLIEHWLCGAMSQPVHYSPAVIDHLIKGNLLLFINNPEISIALASYLSLKGSLSMYVIALALADNAYKLAIKRPAQTDRERDFIEQILALKVTLNKQILAEAETLTHDRYQSCQTCWEHGELNEQVCRTITNQPQTFFGFRKYFVGSSHKEEKLPDHELSGHPYFILEGLLDRVLMGYAKPWAMPDYRIEDDTENKILADIMLRLDFLVVKLIPIAAARATKQSNGVTSTATENHNDAQYT